MANKQDLIDHVTARTGFSRRDVMTIVEAVLQYTTDTLAQGGAVRLQGFGAFTTEHRKGWTGRNPRTGEDIVIPAKITTKFKPALAVKEAIQG